MKHLFPALTAAKANVAELDRLREGQTQLQVQGIHPEAAAANFPLLTAKLTPKEVAALKASFPREGFVKEIAALEGEGKEFAALLSGKGAVLPSQSWKLIHSAKPEAVLWVAHTSKAAGIQAKFKSFITEWPQARMKIPYALMQEMRIVPGVPNYDELLEKLFFELMDNKLQTVEEMKAFLEPYSPPAPPPPIHLRRPRAAKKEARAPKAKKKEVVEGGEQIVLEPGELIAAAETIEQAPAKPVKLAPVVAKTEAAAAGKKAVAAKQVAPAAATPAAEKKAPAKVVALAAKGKAVAKPAVKAVAKTVAAKAPAKKVQTKPAAKKVAVKAPAKKVAPKKAAVKKIVAKAVAKKAPVKGTAKPAAKKVAAKTVAKKAPAKVAAKKAPAKKAPVKAVAKKKR